MQLFQIYLAWNAAFIIFIMREYWICSVKRLLLCILEIHRWASTSTLMSAISDINICYSDYIGLKSVIPILEIPRYPHQSPFWCQILNFFHLIGWNQTYDHGSMHERPITVLIYKHWDIRYRISVQYDIGGSDIRYSPILLITDIGLSAYLCRIYHVVRIYSAVCLQKWV
jgi:hypothetical protein